MRARARCARSASDDSDDSDDGDSDGDRQRRGRSSHNKLQFHVQCCCGAGGGGGIGVVPTWWCKIVCLFCQQRVTGYPLSPRAAALHHQLMMASGTLRPFGDALILFDVFVCVWQPKPLVLVICLYYRALRCAMGV